jgi:hypothetical protein
LQRTMVLQKDKIVSAASHRGIKENSNPIRDFVIVKEKSKKRNKVAEEESKSQRVFEMKEKEIKPM